jgi:hypothetical protein
MPLTVPGALLGIAYYAVTGIRPQPWILIMLGVVGFGVTCWGFYQLWLIIAG